MECFSCIRSSNNSPSRPTEYTHLMGTPTPHVLDPILEPIYECTKDILDPFSNLFERDMLQANVGGILFPTKAQIDLALCKDIKITDKHIKAFAIRHKETLKTGVECKIEKLANTWKTEPTFTYREAEKMVKSVFGDRTVDLDVIFILKLFCTDVELSSTSIMQTSAYQKLIDHVKD